MSKLVTNDDGTITIPLRPVEGAAAPITEITLPEPDFDQLCDIMEMVAAADESLPQAEMLSPDATGEQLRAATDVLRQRNRQTFSREGPYIEVLIKTIKLLTDEDLVRAQLPGWAGSPRTMQTLLSHFQNPLLGGE